MREIEQNMVIYNNNKYLGVKGRWGLPEKLVEEESDPVEKQYKIHISERKIDMKKCS